MPTASQPRILMVGESAPADAQATLEAAGFAVSPTGFGGIDPAEVARSQAVLISVNAKVLNSFVGEYAWLEFAQQ